MPNHTNHYGLVIGIDHYPAFRSLKGAQNDARDFYAWLLNTDIGGGVPSDNVELVLSKPDPIRPIHEDIDDALEKILLSAREMNAERLYVYFSGHGLARGNLLTDLCLARWSKLRRAMALDSSNYLKLVMNCGFFREVVFLLDCCRVREIRSTALPSTIELPRPGDGAPASRSFVAYASEFMNAAFEADVAEGDANEGENGQGEVRGHFTRALLQALHGAAADLSGGVRASKLKEYIEVHTPLIARLNKHVQKPEVINGLESGVEPIFGTAKPQSGVIINITFQAGRTGVVVVEDGHLMELKRGDIASGPWRLPVNGRTLLLIRHEESDDMQTVRVNGDEKEEINVTF